jgi:hypothetical protein
MIMSGRQEQIANGRKYAVGIISVMNGGGRFG